MPNHIAPMANIVVKGIAPEECFPQIKKLMKTPRVKMMPGYRVAVERSLRNYIRSIFINFFNLGIRIAPEEFFPKYKS